MMNTISKLKNIPMRIGFACLVIAALFAVHLPSTADAQFGRRGMVIEPAVVESNDDETEGAGLKTDPDLESTLKRAERFRNDGKYSTAAKLWQAVLERSGDALYSSDGKIYYSLGEQVESIIATLPKEGLKLYRITADANAKEVLAAAATSTRVTALSKIVKEFFISSLGDDARAQLGNYYLDRFDFVGAIRLYKKIIDRYPDPSVELDEVWSRLALAYAYVGNKEASDEAMTKAKALAGGNKSNYFQQITTAIENAQAFVRSSDEQRTWSMRLGSRSPHRRHAGVSSDTYGPGPRAGLDLFDRSP